MKKKSSMKSNCINTPLISRGGNGLLSDVRMLVWQFGYDESKREQLLDAMERLEDVASFLKLARIRENSLFQCLFLSRLGFPENKDFYRRPNISKTFSWLFLKRIYWIVVKHLPRHPFSLHLRDCSLIPSQSAPPNAGAGFVHVRYDFCIPPPHVTERVAKVSTRCICRQPPINEFVYCRLEEKAAKTELDMQKWNLTP